MSLSEYENFLYSACLIDWDEASRLMLHVRDRLDAGGEIRILSGDTDLRLSLKGQRGMIDDGRMNMPGGGLTLDTDPGASFLGELGFGCNYGITTFTNSTLFDEKIGGSVHVALGMAYGTALERNQSSIHVDLIKDLRHGGQVWLNNEKILVNGEFTFAKNNTLSSEAEP